MYKQIWKLVALNYSVWCIKIAVRTLLCKPACFLVCVWSELLFSSTGSMFGIPDTSCFMAFGVGGGEKAKIQAASAEVIRLLMDSLWNILLLKAQCPGTPALSHVDPPNPNLSLYTQSTAACKKRRIPRGYLVGYIPILFTGWHETYRNSEQNPSGVSAHTHNTHVWTQ